MPTHVLNDAELAVVREGLAAASLLDSPELQGIIRSLMVEAFTAFTETKPTEASQREDSYNLIRGLKAIEAELTARVQRKAELERRLDADAEEAEDPIIDDAEFGEPSN